MKKWIWILLALLVIGAGGFYVNQKLPEWMIKGSLTYLEKNNYEPILESETLPLDADQKVLAKEMLQTASYEVKGTQIEGDEAFVSVDLTLINLKQLVYDERDKIFKNTLSDWKKTLDDLFNQKIEGIVVRQLATVVKETSDKPMMNLTVNVPFKRHYLWWEPNLTEEWIQSVIEQYMTKE